jgi:hypothetical protein
MTMLAALQDSAHLVTTHAALLHGGGEVILANNIPDGAADAPEEIKNKVNVLIGLAKYGGLAAAVIGVIALAISLMLAAKGRGGGEDHGKGALILGIGMLLLGSASSVVGFVVG